ncbi:MAG: ABC transporter substrate-binding protein [Anaerolineales bacterium]|nr:ABC transporter substrate-binding protein [Anaerolineales bacterium]
MTDPASGGELAGSDGPRRGGWLRWGYERTPDGFFDPALASAMPMTFNKWVYEALVHIDPGFSELIPRLAVSWRPEEEGKAWVFDLRQGVRFHHGREFVADDVVHTFERILDPEFGSPGLSVFSNITEIEPLDDHTVRFRLDAANADFPTSLANSQALIVPHDLTDEQINGEPRGTGPFTIDRYISADRITFERNDDYWEDGIPYLDAIEAVCIPEATTLTNALQAGEIDVVHILSAVHAPMLEQAEGIHLAFSPATYKEYIYMRLDREPFTDERVRRAFKLIPDRNAMRDLVWGELPARTNDDNPVIPTSPVHAETDIWRQDLEEARRLLQEAGYGDGLELDLWAINDQYGIMEFSLAFADWAAQAGVTINIQGVPSDRFYAEKWLDVPLGTVSWSPRTTADEQLRISYVSDAPWNETAYKSAEFDAMLNEALQEIDPDRRKELYEALQRKLITEGGQIIHCHSPLISGVRDSVHDYVFHPLGDLEPRYIWLS